MTKDDIGAIRIADDLSYVEIREESVPGFLTALGSEMTIEGSKEVVQLDGAPDVPAFERPKPGRGFKGKPRPKTGRPDWKETPPRRKDNSKPDGRKPRASTDGKTNPARSERAEAGEPKFQPKGVKSKPRSAREGTPKDGKPKIGGKVAKGPPPPKGKPSSKKNRARAAAAKAAKGGDAVPKRRKS